MYRQLCWLISLVFVLALGLAPVTQGADPDLVGWWWFDEAGGATAGDSSGYGNNGTLQGGAGWAPGYFKTALELDGVDGYVEVPHNETLNTDDEATVMAWINTTRLETPGQGYQGVIAKGDWGGARSYSLYTTPNGMHFSTGPSGAYIGSSSSGGPVPTNEWVHVCAMIVDSGHAYFVNGEPAGTGGAGAVGPGAADTESVVIGRTQEGTTRSFEGLIDDARIYVRGLTQAEIQAIMTGADLVSSAAGNPSPEDGIIDVPRDAVLSWTAGEFAATHDVYLGTVLDDVNNASRTNPMGLLLSEGQADTSYDPDGLLELGQTYYWRVDEVNAAPDNAIFKGTVWTFTAEPMAYPIEGVIATTNATPQAGAVVENTVNGSGLNADDQHSTKATDMFLGIPGADPIYLQYEFDQVYKLHEVHVWNYNVQFELLLGFGIKDVTVEYSENGTDWTVLGDVELAQATAKPDDVYNTTIDFGGVAVRYVKLTVNSAFGMMGQYGLSEVRFMFIPASAREPQPDDGAADVSVATMLAWRAGRDAISHEVNFGTDPNALDLAGTVDAPSFDPGTLDLGTTYYWKIDEIQDAESWEGAVWSFATQAYVVVDDFESYDDDENRIYDTWIDGFGVADNGSQVGHLEAPFAETSIVNSGRQSMPLFYDNTGTSMSEAELDLAQNWTTNGIKSLALYFQGAADNGGQLYVKINGTKVPYDGDASDIARAVWQPWNIDLSTVGGNISNVTSLIVGIEGAGASGVVYVDDVRLYPKEPEYITPVEPDAANLVGNWTFEGNANDSSGNGLHGTVNGAPTYVAGPVGQAINLNGTTDWVVVGPVGISGTDARTISGWAKPDTMTIPDWCNIFGFTGATGTANLSFDMNKRGGQDQYCIHVYGWERNIMAIDLEWHHLAATYDGTTIAWYGDGRFVGSEDREINTDDIVHMGKRAHSDVMWPGSIDEVRIYNQALSDAEALWLAGGREPIHKPF